MADVIGGHIDMFYAGLAAAKAAIVTGAVKPLAVTGDARSSALPDVPTFKEAGMTDFDLASWNDARWRRRERPPTFLRCCGRKPRSRSPIPRSASSIAVQGIERSPTQDVRAFLVKERDNFGRVVRDLGITMD